MLQARLIIGILFCMLLGTVASAYVNQQSPSALKKSTVPYNLNCGFQYFLDDSMTKAQVATCAQPNDLIPIEFDIQDYTALASGTKKSIPIKINGMAAFADQTIAALNTSPSTINPCIVQHNFNSVKIEVPPVSKKQAGLDLDEMYRLSKNFILGRPQQSIPVNASAIPEAPRSCTVYDASTYEKQEAAKNFATQILEAEKNGGVQEKFEKFMELYAPLALYVEKNSGVSAQVFLIQIGIESGWGTYQAAVELNNVGGLGHSWCESARAKAINESGKPSFHGPVAYGEDPIPLECGGRSEVGQSYFKFANIEDYVRMWMHTYFLSKDHRGIETRMNVCLAHLKENKPNAAYTSASLQGYASAPGYIGKINSEIVGKKALLEKYLSKPLCPN